MHKIINRFNGQLSVEYCGLTDSELYNETFYILDNGSAKKWSVEKRPGTYFLCPTLDGGPSKIIDTVNKTLILNPAGVVVYDKKKEELETIPITAGTPGSNPVPVSFENFILKFSAIPGNVQVGDRIILGGKDLYEVTGISGVDVTLRPLFGSESGIFYDSANLLTVKSSPWTLKQIQELDFVSTKDGLIAVHEQVKPKLISPDGNITDINFGSTTFPGNPFSAEVYSNRLFLLVKSGTGISIYVSRVGSYYDFAPAANDAAAPIQINPEAIKAVDARWIASNSMGVVIGTAEGIYFLRNKAGVGIFDATLPTYLREISDIGAHFVFPHTHSDALYYATEEGKGVATVKPMPYYEETNVRVARVSDYSDVFETFGPIMKITRASPEVHFMYYLTTSGTIGVARPVDGERENSLFLSTWSVGHFDSAYIDVERMAYPGEKDSLMFCVRRGMRHVMKYFIEIMRFPDKFKKPEYLEDFYAPTNLHTESSYYSATVKALIERTFLDSSFYYHADRGRPVVDLTLSGDTLTSAVDLFKAEYVGETIISAEGEYFTFKEYVDPKNMKFFDHGQEKPPVLTGWRYVTNKVPASHLLDENTHSLIVVTDGIRQTEERSNPCAIDTDYVAPYKFVRKGGNFEFEFFASTFVIGIPYRFLYVTNPIALEGYDRRPPLTGASVLCSMSGDFRVSTTDEDHDYVQHDKEPKGTPFYFLETKEADLLSDSRAEHQKVKITQESGSPLTILSVKIRFS